MQEEPAEPSRFRSLRDPETLKVLVERLPVAVYVTNEQGEILDANPGCLRLLGFDSVEALRAHRAQDLFLDPTQRERELAALDTVGKLRRYELGLRRRDGEVRTVLDTCYLVVDPVSGERLYHGILLNISDRKALEERLRDQSRRDALTGCFNRRYLKTIEASAGAAGPWGVLVIDIDDFKRYNDEHGHDEGDDVLVRLTRFLDRQVRANDAVVRVGGDEFLLVLTAEAAEQTESVAERIVAGGEDPAPVPISLGWAVRCSGESLEETIRRADQDLVAVRRRERGLDRRRT